MHVGILVLIIRSDLLKAFSGSNAVLLLPLRLWVCLGPHEWRANAVQQMSSHATQSSSLNVPSQSLAVHSVFQQSHLALVPAFS